MNNNRQDNQRTTSAYRSGAVQGYRPISSQQTRKVKSHKLRHFLLFVILLTLIGGTIYSIKGTAKTINYQATSNTLKSAGSKPIETAVNECVGNTLSKEVLVILSKQHLWACNYQTAIYNAPVVTGYTGNPSNLTPPGTYHIFNKYTNVNLTGSDDMGSWNVHVNYWMPFLFNQYGAYGLHDANWVKPSQFGHINTDTEQASHGCVELPEPTAKWIYNWVDVGTTVSIQST